MSDTHKKTLRLGTRGSQLALWQSNWIKSKLEVLGYSVELITIKTEGDLIPGSLVKIGGQGLFTKQLQVALLENQIDFAVHSLKDLPTETHPDLFLAAVPKREDPRDVLLSIDNRQLSELPANAIVGTGSVRRAAQILHARPDLQVKDIRGNVETRIRKLNESEYDAIILARAGLVRLELDHHITEVFDKSTLMPAVGQGALGVEIRRHDAETLAAVSQLRDDESFPAVLAEREMLRNLQGGCLAPIGAWTTVTEGQLKLEGVVLSTDGKEKICAEITKPISEANEIGTLVADSLRDAGATRFLED